jgi:hypothetical protein
LENFRRPSPADPIGVSPDKVGPAGGYFAKLREISGLIPAILGKLLLAPGDTPAQACFPSVNLNEPLRFFRCGSFPPPSSSIARLSMNPLSHHPSRALVVACLLGVLAPRGGRAENAVAYKYESYQESAGRIAVQTRSALLDQDLGTEMHLKLLGVIDAITGATPNGMPAPAGSDQVPLSDLHPERRKAWNADLSRQFQRVNVDFGFGNSRESDYVSNGWSVNTVTDFNQKNTTLIAGFAGTDDKIKVLYSSRAPRARKHTNDVLLGVNQLLDPHTSVGLSLTWGRASGFLSDPYRLVEKDQEIFPGVVLPFTPTENRPAYREKWTALVSVNHAFGDTGGAIDASYRYYHDTFSVDAHTVDVAWLQKLGSKFILRPSFRFYDQTAAYFYHYNLNQTAITPLAGPPRPQGPFYSSDYRLTSMQTFTYGLKLVWNVRDNLQFDIAREQYDMRGTDHVTPQSAYARAKIITLGAKFSW